MRTALLGLVLAMALGACQTTQSPAPVAVAPPAPAAVPEPEPEPVDPTEALFPDLTAFVVDHPPRAVHTPDVLQADLLIRLRTELMVTGLTCHAQYEEPELYSRYMTFMLDHQARIREAQQVLGGFLGSHLGGNPNRRFDTYITDLANTESKVVSDLSAREYCAARRDQFYSVTGFDPVELADHIDVAGNRYAQFYRLEVPVASSGSGTQG